MPCIYLQSTFSEANRVGSDPLFWKNLYGNPVVRKKRLGHE